MSFITHLRQSWRVLASSPGFALFAILTMALGLGVGTAMFEVFESILLRPLPYRDAGSLVEVFSASPSFEILMSEADYESIRAAGLFERIALRHPEDFDFEGLGASEPAVAAMAASDEFFETLGTQARRGRTFSAKDGGAKVAVLSHGFWRRLGSDPDAVGKVVRLDSSLYTVIGVMPPDFELLDQSSLWVPLSPSDTVNHGSDSWVVARLRRDLSPGQLKARLDVMSANLSSPAMPFSYRIHSVREIVVGKYRPLLTILTGSILFVFLLACSNVSNLILARHSRRRVEFAIRVALGAEIPDLLFPLLAESGLICSSGLAIGLVLSRWIREATQRMIPVAMPRLDQAGLNSQVILFAAGLTGLSVLLVSVLPLIEIFRQTPHSPIKGARSGEQPGTLAGFSRRAVLLVANSALAMVLLVGAVLMLQSLTGLLAIDIGFSPKQLFTAAVCLSPSKYSTDQKVVSVFQDMLHNVALIHGLKHAAIANAIPLGGTGTSVQIETETGAGGRRQQFVEVSIASSGLFGVYGVPFLAGRDFEPSDAIGHPRVALVSQLAAKMLWPNESAIGKRFRGGWGSKGALTEVVGVVGDVRALKLQTPPAPTVYLPYTQVPSSTMFIVARSGLPVSPLTSAVSEAVKGVDRDQRLDNIRTGDDLLSASLREPEFVGGLLGGFSLLALLLSAIGVYGVVSYWVSQSTREIGVRIALGAQRTAVVRMVIGRTFRIAAVGLAAGLFVSLAVVHFLSSVLYEVQPRNPVSLLLGAAVVAAVTLVAAAAPAVRAATVDPIRALRCD